MRVLLAAQTFEGASGWHIARTLAKMGHAVRAFDPGWLLVPPYKNRYALAEIFLRQVVRVTNRLAPLRATIHAATNARLARAARAWSPDVVLVVKGEQILPRTIARIRAARVTTINWCFDDPFLWLAQPEETLASYDCFFVVDHAYVARARARVPHARVEYLPQCCDPDIHKTLPLAPAERARLGNAVCFVGSMYPHRVEMFAGLEQFDFGIWGSFWRRAPHAGLRRCYRGREAYGIEKTRVFNASHIVLNTHHPQAIRATNLRTYEVTGCGAFLLSDRRDDLTRLFREGVEFVGFEGREDLFAKITYYLDHADARATIARQGQARTHAEHTYENRLTQLLARVK